MAKGDLFSARRTLWAFAAVAGFCVWVTLAAGCGGGSGSGGVLAMSADRRVSLLITTPSKAPALKETEVCLPDRFRLAVAPETGNQAVVDLIARNTASRHVGVYPVPAASAQAAPVFEVVLSGTPNIFALVQQLSREPAVVSAYPICLVVN